MTDENNKLLVDLEVRIKQVIYLCDSLKGENKRLENEIAAYKVRLGETTGALDRLKTKYDSLKTARTITAASVDVKTAGDKLSKLVREVDKCINLLR